MHKFLAIVFAIFATTASAEITGAGATFPFQSNEWPITAPTYIIMYKTPVDAAAQKEAFKFFQWAYDNGDKMADDLDYVPLSKEVKAAIVKGW